MKQFVAREERARSEPVQDRRKRERSLEHIRDEKEQKRSVPSPRKDIQTENRITEEILMINGGMPRRRV